MRRLAPLFVSAVLFALVALAPRSALATVFRTVLIIDASGSMKWTDPKEIRKVAAEIYVDLARDGDQIAVTGFDGGVRQSTGAFITLGSEADRARVKAAIRAVGNDGAHTDFTAALGEARRLFGAAPKTRDVREFVVLLTDGECDPERVGVFAKGNAELECKRIVTDELVPALAPARIYAIGFGGAAGQGPFFEEVAAKSGGGALVTTRADELPELFARTYASIFGSRLTAGAALARTPITVDTGAPSLDVVVVSPAAGRASLIDPTGRAIEHGAGGVTIVESPAYRFFRVPKPAAGSWILSAGGGRYVALEELDLDFRFVDAPEIVEVGRSARVRLQLVTSAGKAPERAFVDRHVVALTSAAAPSGCAEVLRRSPGAVPLARVADGTWEATVPATAAGELCVEARITPAQGGILSRVASSPPIRVVTPIHLVAGVVDVGPVKQGTAAEARLSFAGSEIGEPLEVSIDIIRKSPALSVSPEVIALSSDGPLDVPITLTADRDAPPGAFERTLHIRPVKPTGREDRAIETTVRGEVIPLTFWERYGTWVKAGLGGVASFIVLLGFVMPARFRKGTMLHYVDARDPHLPREGSYPLAAKAKAKFFRGARALVGASGPVRMGGVVELRAGPGGAIFARPLGEARAREVPKPDEWGGFAGEPREVRLDRGAFRASAGARYEIEGSGLTFWYTLR